MTQDNLDRAHLVHPVRAATAHKTSLPLPTSPSHRPYALEIVMTGARGAREAMEVPRPVTDHGWRTGIRVEARDAAAYDGFSSNVSLYVPPALYNRSNARVTSRSSVSAAQPQPRPWVH